jgi:hypothetical protein
MKTIQITSELNEQKLSSSANDEVSESVFNLTSFIEILAEIDQAIKENRLLSNK